MTLTLSFSLNATLFTAERYQTATLDLVRLTMPLARWQPCVRLADTALKLAQIACNTLAFAMQRNATVQRNGL